MSRILWLFCLVTSTCAWASHGTPSSVGGFCNDATRGRVLYVFNTGEEGGCGSRAHVYDARTGASRELAGCLDEAEPSPLHGCVALAPVDLSKSGARVSAKWTGKTAMGSLGDPTCRFQLMVVGRNTLRAIIDVGCQLAQKAELTAFALPGGRRAVVVVSAPLAQFAHHQVLGTVLLDRVAHLAQPLELELKIAPEVLARTLADISAELESKRAFDHAIDMIVRANEIPGVAPRPEWRFREAVLATRAGNVDAALQPLAAALSFRASRSGFQARLDSEASLRPLLDHKNAPRCDDSGCEVSVKRGWSDETLRLREGVERLVRRERYQNDKLVERYDAADGGYRRWSPEGQLMEEGTVIDGKREGRYHVYFGMNGSTFHTDYRAGVKHGSEREEAPDGQPIRVQEFRDGVENGWSIDYLKGKLYLASTFRDGGRDGPMMQWLGGDLRGGEHSPADGGSGSVFVWRNGALAGVEHYEQNRMVRQCYQRQHDDAGCCLAYELDELGNTFRSGVCCGSRPDEFTGPSDGGDRALCDRLQAIAPPNTPPSFPRPPP